MNSGSERRHLRKPRLSYYSMKYLRPLVKLPSSYRILLALLLFRWLLIPDEEVAAASVSGSKRLNMESVWVDQFHPLVFLSKGKSFGRRGCTFWYTACVCHLVRLPSLCVRRLESGHTQCRSWRVASVQRNRLGDAERFSLSTRTLGW